MHCLSHGRVVFQIFALHYVDICSVVVVLLDQEEGRGGL